MATPPSPLVQMYAPDGTLGSVPYERMHEALQAGGKMAVNMSAPDGTPGVVPADKVPDAVKAGGKVIPYDLETQPDKEGFVSHAVGYLKGMVPTEKPSMTDAIVGPASTAAKQLYGAGKQAVTSLQQGHGLPYSAAAGAATAVGVNVPKMEQAAEQGDPGGVLGEAAVPAGIAAGAYGASRAMNALPSAARAGAALQDVKSAAGHVPIDMGGPGDTAMQIYYEAKHGAFLPKPVNDLLKRIGLDPSEMTPNNRPISYQTAANRGAIDPNSPPLTYAEAKSFQSNISNLTASDKLSTNANIKRLVGQLNSNLKDSLEGAADTVGKGEQFTKAMKEYHNAMTLRGMTDSAKDAAWKAALTGVGLEGVKKILGL
jgi:hypothetical protein